MLDYKILFWGHVVHKNVTINIINWRALTVFCLQNRQNLNKITLKASRIPGVYHRPMKSDFPRNSLTMCVLGVSGEKGVGSFTPVHTLRLPFTDLLLLSCSEAGSFHCSLLPVYQAVTAIPLLSNIVRLLKKNDNYHKNDKFLCKIRVNIL